MEESEKIFWNGLDRRIRRTEKFIHWMINGQFQHGISPMVFIDLTPEKVEEIYNVDFGD
jgi:hypothetical protein